MALERKLWQVSEGSMSIHWVMAIKKMTTDVVIVSLYGKILSAYLIIAEFIGSFWATTQGGFRNWGPVT